LVLNIKDFTIYQIIERETTETIQFRWSSS
jgi:hypothetical protein